MAKRKSVAQPALLESEEAPIPPEWAEAIIPMACGHTQNLGQRSPDQIRFLERNSRDAARCVECIRDDKWDLP